VPADVTLDVLGVHPVSDLESCYLIEMMIDGTDVAPDFGSFTQPVCDRPSPDWQVAYDERLLDDGGERVVADLLIHPPTAWPKLARVAFFFHFLDTTRALATPFGDVTLPPATPAPARLSFLTYEAP
jgi:hypothetical protein